MRRIDAAEIRRGESEMVRSLAEALSREPLFFAPAPPSGRISAPRAAERVDEIVRLLERTPRVDAIDVPELVDENHDGRPRYRSGDPRLFAAELASRVGREAIVNKVVAHLESATAVASWAEETVRTGVRHTVLVGGSSRFIPYPGPPVAEANRVVRPILARSNGLLGNIAIPQRRGEAHRMLSKTRAGASFFTTQLVFSAESVGTMLADYDRLCREVPMTPAAVVLSFAPVADESDIEFVRWLGADMPEAAERLLLEDGESDAAERSVRLATEVWETVRARAAREHLRVLLGVNVEQLSSRHLGHAEALLASFVQRLPNVAVATY